MTRGLTLVTGAGGFIGGRMVEALLQLEQPVRPALRRWSTAARIGRYPVEPFQCDLMNADQVNAAVQGVDAVIHCAVGNRDVTVTGTRNMLEAAVGAGVRRFVHLSTVDVYGRATGALDEQDDVHITGREYGDSKIEAEIVCREFAERSPLEVVVLRPTIVYGPYSELWTVEPATRLMSGSWRLPSELCQGTCNLVYVDDLVSAALTAVDAPGVNGAVFNINGPVSVTWQQYIEALNTALGLPKLNPPRALESRTRSAFVKPVRNAIKSVFRRMEDPIMDIYRRSRHARRVMKWVQGSLEKVPSSAEYDLYGRSVSFSNDRAMSKLGYRPLVDMAEGVDLSVAWLQHVGIAR